jgi:hypothetical protein
LSQGNSTSSRFAWLAEGGAQYFAREQLRELEIRPVERPEVLNGCKYALSQLEVFNEAQDQDCIYEEGEAAVRLLIAYWGPEKYYELWRSLAHNSLSVAVENTYGVALEDIYDLFWEYRRLNFREIPLFATPAMP